MSMDGCTNKAVGFHLDMCLHDLDMQGHKLTLSQEMSQKGHDVLLKEIPPNLVSGSSAPILYSFWEELCNQSGHSRVSICRWRRTSSNSFQFSVRPLRPPVIRPGLLLSEQKLRDGYAKNLPY